MLVPRLLLTLCPSPPLPEEEQAALPHRCHHQLPGSLCFAGGPPRGLCPLHAPAVSNKPAAVFLQGHLRQGWIQLLCFAIYSATDIALQAGGILPISGFSFAAFLKHLGTEAEGPPWCLPPPGLLHAPLTQGMVPAGHPWGPNRDTQLHKQHCPQSPCFDGALFHPSPGASGA